MNKFVNLVLVFVFLFASFVKAPVAKAGLLASCRNASYLDGECFPTYAQGQNLLFRIDQIGTGFGDITSQAEINQLINDTAPLWDMPTSSLQFRQDLRNGSGLLDINADVNNYLSLLFPFAPLGYSPIILDNNSEITIDRLGFSARNRTLGFASAPITGRDTQKNVIDHSYTVMNDYFMRTSNFSSLSLNDLKNLFKAVFLHEIAHMAGIGHTGVHNDADRESDNLATPNRLPGGPSTAAEFRALVPLMFPIAHNGTTNLREEDKAIMSAAYPTNTFTNTLGTIKGRLQTPQGNPILGVNLSAYKIAELTDVLVNDPGIGLALNNDTQIPPQPLNQMLPFTFAYGNAASTQGGSEFFISGLQPGKYAVRVEKIGFTGGSGIGAYEPSATDPVEGYYNGPNNPLVPTLSAVTANQGIITINAGQTDTSVRITDSNFSDDRPNTPADSMALNSPIILDSNNRSSSSNLAFEAKGDSDVFTFQLPEFGMATFTSVSSTNAYGELIDSAGKVLDSADDNLNTAREFTISRLLVPGTYNLAMTQSIDDHTDSSLRLDASFVPGLPSDDFGDTIANATDLPLDSDLSARIDFPHDVDIFRVVVPTKDTYFFDTGDFQTKIRLLDQSGMLLFSSPLFGSKGALTVALDPGTYYMEVRSKDRNTTTTYTAEFDRASRFSNIDSHVLDTANDNVNGAIALDLINNTSQSVNGAIDDHLDIDFYSFTLNQERLVTIESSNTVSSLDLIGRLHDGQGAEIFLDVFSGPGDNFKIQRLLQPGTYYISLSEFFIDTNTYTLNVSAAPVPTTVFLGDIYSQQLLELDPIVTRFQDFPGDVDTIPLVLPSTIQGANGSINVNSASLRIKSKGEANTYGRLLGAGNQFSSYHQNDLPKFDFDIFEPRLTPGNYNLEVSAKFADLDAGTSVIEFDFNMNPNASFVLNGTAVDQCSAPNRLVQASCAGIPVRSFARINQPIIFDASSSQDDGTISLYMWDFGDNTQVQGSTTTTQHTYTSTGVFVPKLKLIDNEFGISDEFTLTQTFEVLPPNQAPTASLQVTNSGTLLDNAPVNLSGAASSDPDQSSGGIQVGSIAKYEFDMDGNGSFETDNATNPAISQTFAIGTHTVALRVTDNEGLTATATVQFTVADSNVAPTAALQVITQNPVDTAAVQISASASSDSDGTIAKYEFDMDGNGSYELDNGTNTEVSQTFTAGQHTVGLRVTDDKGKTGTTTVQFTVTGTNQAPNAVLQVVTQNPVDNAAVQLTGASSSDSDGTIAKYEFDMDGNGSYEVDNGSTATISQTFAAGQHTVGLRVTDNQGALGTTTVQFTVAASNQAPVAAFTFSPNSNLQTNQAISFDASTSTDDNGISSYAWDFGDSQTASGQTTSHTYTTAGTFTVTLTVTDAGGLTNTTTQSLTVAAPSNTGGSGSGGGSSGGGSSGGGSSGGGSSGGGSSGGSTQSQNEAPVANFSFTPAEPKTGELVNFVNLSTDDGGSANLTYQWSIGGQASSSETSPSFTFNSAGSFSVILSVQDREGLSASITKTVVVLEAETTGTDNPPNDDNGENPPAQTPASPFTINGNDPAQQQDGSVAPLNSTVPTLRGGRKLTAIDLEFALNEQAATVLKAAETASDELRIRVIVDKTFTRGQAAGRAAARIRRRVVRLGGANGKTQVRNRLLVSNRNLQRLIKREKVVADSLGQVEIPITLKIKGMDDIQTKVVVQPRAKKTKTEESSQ